RAEGRVVSGAVILAYGRRLHHHLSGSAADAQQVGPNNLLFHEIAAWGRAHGYLWLHLGGGATNASDDRLLRFKKNFSSVRPKFVVGRGVYDADRHEEFRAKWLAANPGRAAGAYFQVYASDEETAP
ncbi:MAG: GNAT family N-acetyltransferase, partial [Candidatus Binatia bacterium]